MSTPASTEPPTPEQRELSLVSKVELRIALVDSDTKLESMLNTYLPPLLLKLASEYSKVRLHVISICQHINTRIKPPSIKLPVAALLKQFKACPNQLVRHFDLLYIHQGIDRIARDERVDLLPPLLQGFCSNYDESAPYAASLFNLLLKILHSLSLPARGSSEDLALRAKLGLNENPEDAEFVATWLGKLILFNINQTGAKRCPGLSVEDCSFLQLQERTDTWTPNARGGLNLIETKVQAAKFLASGAFIDSDRFLPALFASADPNSRLADIGEDILKRAASAVSLEGHALIKKLFEIYLGTRGAEGSLPPRAPLQTKILTLLSKSKLSSSFVPQSIQIVREGLTLVENGTQHETVGSSKQGLEASKLRVQVFAFTNWLARISSPEDIRAFGSDIVFRLRDYIESQGWPRVQSEGPRPSPGELKARGYGYECIGLLAASCADSVLIEPNLDILRWLFTALSADPSGNDISISVEQALGSVLGAFGQVLDPEIEEPLTDLLLSHMSLKTDGLSTVRSTWFVAVRFANRCLPYRNVTARWINLLAIGGDANDRSEVKEEGKKGLDPYWYRMFNPPKDALATDNARYQFPSFPDLVEKFFGAGTRWDTEIPAGNQVQLANAYNPAVSFCRYILLHHALSSTDKAPDINAEWERNIDALVVNDEESRAHIKDHMKTFLATYNRSSQAFQVYLIASFRGMTDHIGDDFHRSGEATLDLVSLSPDSALDQLTKNVLSLQNSILSNQRSTRETASRLFGVLASRGQCPNETIKNMLQVFDQKIRNWRQAIGTEVFQVHGSLLATAYFLSRLTYRGRPLPDYGELELKFVTSILEILSDSRDKMLLDAAITAFADLSLFSAISPEKIPPSHQVSLVLQKLKEKSKNGDEKAIGALGYFAMQCPETGSEYSILDEIFKILYDLQEVRQPEVQFAVGSSLACAAVGWRSKALVATLEIQGPSPQTPERNSVLSKVFDKVLSDCRTTKPSLRQASVIWLLCLVQYCGHLEEAQIRLRICQSTFKSFLSDRDSLNQESASRGLTLVYEKGNRSLKDDLIRDLVGSFTGTGAGLAGNVSDDTQLFEPGALPTGEGSVTTYKDIMSLASEVGDPGLVYRFMSLASNNAIWSSRAAFGRFGLSNILSDSSVDGYLAQNPKLYPALFRYRFDPNTNVRNSMNDIWNALVRDPTAIINRHFDSIMDDLLKNIVGREWRVRQASCAAIADLVQGRALEKYEKYLTQIWTLTFKVCDDIKDSVRTAAMSLAKVLTGVLTRSLEAADSSSGNANTMLKEVLPFLLSPSGLESSAKEVQLFALVTLLQIIKSSNGKTLRPFIPDLVGHLLALLSSLEPQEVNYLHLNAGQYDLTTQQIDDARLNSVRGSPMMEAIERCLDFLDEQTMAALSPSLENAIKTAIGLPSKVGSMRAIVSLSTRQNYIFKNYADRFLRLVLKQVLDRNETVSSSYAVGCGYLARLASEGENLNLVKYCQGLYFDSDDEVHRCVSGDIIYAVSKNATDRFNSIASDVLPFVFIAKHDDSERVREYFQDTWNENVGGSRAVLLYLKEIISLASQHLDSPRWFVKHTSATAIAEVVTSSGSEISDSNAKIIWPALEKAVGGKTWEGKVKVLKALVEFVKSSKILALDEDIAKQIQMIFLRESKRNNLPFRRHAIACLGEFVQLQGSVDLYPAVYSITEPIITEALSATDDMDVDSQSEALSSKLLTEATLANSLGALLKSVSPSQQSDTALTSNLSQTLTLINQATISTLGSRMVLDSIYDAEKSLFDRLASTQPIPLPRSLEEILLAYIPTLFPKPRPMPDVEQTRIKAAEASISLAKLARARTKTNTPLSLALTSALAAARQEERALSVQQTLDRAKGVLLLDVE